MQIGTLLPSCLLSMEVPFVPGRSIDALEPTIATPVGRPLKVNNGGKLPPIERGKTRDKIAAFTGIAARTLDKESGRINLGASCHTHATFGQVA